MHTLELIKSDLKVSIILSDSIYSLWFLLLSSSVKISTVSSTIFSVSNLILSLSVGLFSISDKIVSMLTKVFNSLDSSDNLSVSSSSKHKKSFSKVLIGQDTKHIPLYPYL